MKRAALFLVFFLMATPLYSQDTMRLVYFNNFPPYSWEENNQMQGILVDILTEAIQNRMGISVSHQGYPWARAQRMVRGGEADAFATVPTPERQEYTVISGEPVIFTKIAPFVNRQNPRMDALKEITTISDLQEFSLGHYTGSGWAENNLKGMDLTYAPSLDSTLIMLAMGRFDVFVDASLVIQYRIMELGLKEQIVELPSVLDSETINLCIGKESPFADIVLLFDETMREMREDNTLNETFNKYR